MPDTLYRSHSLEKSTNDGQVVTSGSITTWENEPVSPFDVGDTFRPVPDGPILTVKKVNISDNVIGTVAGKTVRQWQISVEGDNSAETSELSQTHVLYNFQFDADGHSGTMEVTNTGNRPSIKLDIGDTFNVPGVGRIPCINVKGSDAYDDNGNHVWSVIYEGSDVQEAKEALPEDRHTFSIEQNDGSLVKSGSIAISSKGSSPSLAYSVGGKLNIPGIGQVTCTKISASDNYSDSGAHVWTITYEGSNEQDEQQGEQGETISRVKYSFSIDKDGNSSVSSGTMQVVNSGNAPAFSLHVGQTFSFPGIGTLTCINISGSNEYNDSGKRIWTVTYQGTVVPPQQDVKYSLSLSKDGSATKSSGSIQAINDGNSPALMYNIGSSLNIPGLGDITCVGISASDDFSEGGIRRWTVTYEGTNDGANGQAHNVRYSFTIDTNGNTGSMQVVNEGDAPALSIQVGWTFFIPGLGNVTCTNISASDEYSETGVHVWTVTYESNPVQVQQSTKYSLNIDKDGSSTVRSGSKQVINEGETPTIDVSVGGELNIPGLGKVTCTNISASDEYSESGARVWNVTYESNPVQTHNTTYSFTKDEDGNSGSMQVINEGNTPSLTVQVGGTFNIPGLGEVTCTNISVSDSYSEGGTHIWTVTYEHNPNSSGSGSSSSSDSSSSSGSSSSTSLPDNEESVSYELNGTTVYTVAGEFIALRRSTKPILKKSITKYTTDAKKLANIGSTYEGGIALSENIIKETIKNDGKVISSYYKHTIEVETEYSSTDSTGE